MKYLSLILIFILSASVFAQQNINSITTKDIKVNGNLEVNSTTKASKPCPDMTESQRDAMAMDETGAARCIYNTNTNQLNIFNGTIWKSAGGGISNWETAFNYALNDVVIESNKIYQCNTAHTSTVFSSDIANWTLISDNLPIDLTTDVTDVLPMANGGTDKALTPVLGGLVYTDDLSMEVLGAGADGQVLKSNGAAAPSWEDASNKVQGQAQTEVDFTKLEFPNQNVTQTGPGSHVVYDSGLIYDGGFESATAFQGHTIVSGSAYFAVVTTASDVLDGKKTARVTCFNAAPSGVCKIEQTVNLGTPRLRGFPMLLSVRVDSSPDQPLTFCAKIDGVEKDCVTGYKGYLTIPTQAGVTSVGYTLSKNEYVSPLTSFFDSIKVEITETVTNAPAIGPRIKYSPTFQGFGTPSNVDCEYNQDGPNLILDCLFTSQSDSASPRIGLPSGLTIGGSWAGNKIAGTFGVGSVGANKGGFALMAVGNSYITLTTRDVIGSASVGTLSTSTLGSDTCTAGTPCSVKAIVPIAQYQASVPTYSDRCRDPRNCETVFSAKVSATGVVSDESLDWINGNCTDLGSALRRCTYNTGIFTQTPNCISSVNADINGGTIRIFNQSSTAFDVRSVIDNTSVPANPLTVTCIKQGQDYLNAKVNQIVGSFKDYNKTEGTTSGRVDDFMFSMAGTTIGTDCTSSPCTVDQIGDYVTSFTRSSTGTYTLNVKRPYTKLRCLYSSQSTGFAGLSSPPLACNNCSSISNIVVRRWDNAAFIDGFLTMHCKGTY